MRNIILASLLLFLFNSNAQTIKIEYEVTINRNTYIKTTKANYELIISDNKSIYYNDGNNIDVFPNIDWKPEIIRNINGKKTVKISDNIYASVSQDYFYKNYELDTILYNDISGKETIIIGEKNDLFDWEIIPKSDTLILNYKCQRATSNFRGREYEAYFIEGLTNYGGPWKFDGLPGLIISVRSKDDYFIINPLKLSATNETEKIINPYINTDRVLTWNEFIASDKKKKLNILKMMQADAHHGESSRIIIKDRIEDMGYYELSSDDL